MFWLTRVIQIVALASLSIVTFYFGRLIYTMYLSKRLVRKAVPFEHQSGSMRLLVVGDSSAIGAGVDDATKSLPGLLSAKHGDMSVVNKAQNGSYISDLKSQLTSQDEDYDIILCASGGMDVLFLQPKEKLGKQLKSFLDVATKKSASVILMTPLNLGLSTGLPFFLRGFYNRRSAAIGGVVGEVAGKYENVILINNLLLQATDNMPEWDTICTVDKIHPNNAGYQWVFEQLEEQLGDFNFQKVS